MADDSGLTDIVRRAAQANAKFYKGWMDLSLEYMRGLSEIFGGAAAAVQSTTPSQEMDAGAATLVLEGEAGTTVSGSFLVSNDLERPISCKLVSADYKDPAGVSVRVRTTFDPAGLELAAGEQKVVRVAVVIDETLTPGVGYAGEIAIAGMDGFAVPVVLRRQHTVDESDAGLPKDFGDDDLTAKASAASVATKASRSAPATTAAKKVAKKTPAKKALRRR